MINFIIYIKTFRATISFSRAQCLESKHAENFKVQHIKGTLRERNFIIHGTRESFSKQDSLREKGQLIISNWESTNLHSRVGRSFSVQSENT